MRWLDGITNSKGHAFEQTLGDTEGKGRLVCCSPWGHKESDMTYWTEQHKKKQIWACSEVDETRDYYTEWNKSERQNKHCILTHIYMESRKMVLMNLFTGHKWRSIHREQTSGHSEGRRCDKLREQHWNIHITICKIRQPVGICWMTQGAQSRCSVTT